MKAFPSKFRNERGNDCYNFGMDLRDYFAAEAMKALINVHGDTGRIVDADNWVSLHLRAYEHADMMMNIRKEPQ